MFNIALTRAKYLVPFPHSNSWWTNMGTPWEWCKTQDVSMSSENSVQTHYSRDQTNDNYSHLCWL